MNVKTIIKNFTCISPNVKQDILDYITFLRSEGVLVFYRTIPDEVNKRIKVVARIEVSS